MLLGDGDFSAPACKLVALYAECLQPVLCILDFLLQFLPSRLVLREFATFKALPTFATAGFEPATNRLSALFQAGRLRYQLRYAAIMEGPKVTAGNSPAASFVAH